MKTKNVKKKPDIIFRNGKPKSVILDINEYREMLERLEDIEDLKTLEEMRKKPLKFRPLDDFLNDKSLVEIEKEDHEEDRNFFTEQEKKALEPIVKEVQEFLKEEATPDAKQTLRELCAGVFESEEDFASNHDHYLYGAPKRK